MVGHRRSSAEPSYPRPIAGAVTVTVIVGIVAAVAVLFRGGLAPTVPVTVLSSRAGLVMNPDAKVELRGVQVGTVSSIEVLPSGVAALHLSMNPDKSIPKDKLGALLDESFKAFNGAGYDLGSLIDSSATLAGSANGVREQTRQLVEDSAPLLDSQAATTADLRVWARSLAGVTRQLHRPTNCSTFRPTCSDRRVSLRSKLFPAGTARSEPAVGAASTNPWS
jgi:ABC-type transporter Mla subunit MlaD